VEATDFSDHLRDYADCRQPQPNQISFIVTNKTRQEGHEEDINFWSVILERRDNLGNPDVDGFDYILITDFCALIIIYS